MRDAFVADGGARRLFRPLWWRTYRYVQLEIETAEEPLAVEDVAGVATSYPFAARARLDTGLPELDRILEVGWRTARLCAHESYMDCPYYEQLQYAGDTRIEALVSLYMTGDARLARNAIEQLDDSRTAEGLTQSRAPTRARGPRGRGGRRRGARGDGPTVLGVDSAAPGFRRVVIRPFLGRLTRVSGAIPHPRGEVAVSLDVRTGQLMAEVTLPDGVEGELVWGGQRRRVPAGASRHTLPAPERPPSGTAAPLR